MKEPVHIGVQLVVFACFSIVLGWQVALIIVLAHFIPTIDFVMKKVNFHAHLHRKLFHNLLALFVTTFIVYFLTEPHIAVFFGLNYFLHFLMDARGKGVAIFYPFSEYRFKITN